MAHRDRAPAPVRRLAAMLQVLLVALACFLPGVAHAFKVALALAQPGGAYQAFADSLQLKLASGGVVLTPAGNLEDGFDDAVLARADLILATGPAAAAAVVEHHRRPTMVALISGAQLAELRGRYPQANLSGFLLEQPAERQIRLMGAVLPKGSRIGMLRSSGTVLDPELARAVSASGYRLIEHSVAGSAEVIAGLEQVLPASDALLVLPDPVLSAPNPARSILLTSYRFRRPIFAFSQAYVEAGALAAVFSAPEDVASDVAGWLRSLGGGVGRLPAPRAPLTYRIAVNRQVARSLNIGVPSDAQLRAQIEAGRER